MCFTSFFTLEMLIKIVGLGPLGYLRDTSNIFDIVIVTVSIVELESVIALYQCYMASPDAITGLLPDCSTTSSGLAVLRAFRLIRVLRIGKLVKAFPQVQRQIKVITKTMGAVSSLVCLMLLFILIYSILGMSLFGAVSVGSLFDTDQDGIPNLRAGAGVRILLPLDPANRTTMFTGRVNSMVWGGGGDGNFTFHCSVITGASETPVDMVIRNMAEIEPENHLSFIAECQENITRLAEPYIVGTVPRSNFDNIAFASLTVFQMLTTSDLGDVLFPAMRGAGPIAVAYTIALIGLGNWMLLNLFLAIIITGFSETKAQVCHPFFVQIHAAMPLAV